ncbi:hypothetical protein F4811DRAFT_513603, partial [Daldinia bambusicola]
MYLRYLSLTTSIFFHLHLHFLAHHSFLQSSILSTRISLTLLLPFFFFFFSYHSYSRESLLIPRIRSPFGICPAYKQQIPRDPKRYPKKGNV